MATFFIRTALMHLRRGGQRMLVALLCIIFGVMSLVAMTIVSHSLLTSLVMTRREQIGGDINGGWAASNIIPPEAEATLQQLQSEGVLTRYTLIAQAGQLMWRRPDSGENHWAYSGLGIDPSQYPYAGRLQLSAPQGVGLPTVLAEVGDVIVTRDLAETYGLKLGDTLILSDLGTGAPVTGHVRGIATDTPNHQGGKMYYTLATAEALAGGQRAVNVVAADAPAPGAALERMSQLGWSGVSVDELGLMETNENFFTLMLKGAGMLGLMVGGIGIANTMQVLLRRRQREIAIWKTLGYTAAELQLLFVLEAALLGTLGSVIGVGLGLLVSRGLLDLITRTGTALVNWTLPPVAVAIGGLAGVATTVIFALWAIVRAAQVPPMLLLRDGQRSARQQAWPQTVLLISLLAVPFTALTTVVMGSFGLALTILGIALVGLIALGGGLGGLAWAGTRLLRVPGLPLLRMAQSSLRRRGLGLVFAMIALFTGVTALALGIQMTQNATAALDARTPTFDSYEVAIVAPAVGEPQIRAALTAQGLSDYQIGYSTAVLSVTVAGLPHALPARLLGQNAEIDYSVTGAPWGSQPDGAYAPQFYGVEAGDTAEVTLADGRVVNVPIVGTYQQNYATSLRFEDGLLLPADTSLALAAPTTVLLYVEAPNNPAAVTAALGAALPEASVVNMPAFAARYIENYRNLFLLAVVMAGLALLAGVLLVANSVSLAMLDRQYEIGVLKAVGYTRRHVLGTLAAEYGLMALIASGAALVFVQAFLMFVSLMSPVAGRLLYLDPGVAAVILATGVGLTLLTVLAATWGPLQASPVVVLNDR